MATATLDELIERTRIKANVLRSNFATDPEIIVYLNEARKQLRELIITADDSYYQATMPDFSIGAAPTNIQALPSDFWKLRGLDAFAGDSLRQQEVYAREFRNRFDPGIGYYFGGDGNSIVVCGQSPEQGNPFRVYYTPRPKKFAALVDGITRTITHNAADTSTIDKTFQLVNGDFSAADTGGTLTLAGTGSGLDGTYTVITVIDRNTLETYPAAPSATTLMGAGTVATMTGLNSHTRSFAVAAPDENDAGTYFLQNGGFGASDVGGYVTLNVTATGQSVTVEILQYVSPTSIRTPLAVGNIPLGTGTATITRQIAGTDNALDLTEDNFSEYLPVRAAMAIARRKRQDTLVQQLGAEREAIEERIAALSRMRQSEPQQAPVLWGHRTRYNDDWEV